jgi:hypothetical protein
MSPHNPGANPGATPGTTSAGSNDSADTQTVIGLLGSLMPLLLQIQMQSGQQPFQRGPWQQGPFAIQPGFAQSAMGPFAGPLAAPGPDQAGLSAPFGGPFGDLAGPNPLLDQQAAVSFVEDITAHSLRALSNYLETYADQYHGLQSCVPIVTQAARSFAARDYAQTFGLIWHAYRLITALRAANPQLPPPRAAGIAGTAFSTSTHVH